MISSGRKVASFTNAAPASVSMEKITGMPRGALSESSWISLVRLAASVAMSKMYSYTRAKPTLFSLNQLSFLLTRVRCTIWEAFWVASIWLSRSATRSSTGWR